MTGRAMNRVRALTSLGGWLAHMLNQFPFENPDNSDSTYPILVGFVVLSFGFGPVVVAWQLLLFCAGIQPQAPLRDPAAYLGVALLGVIVLWLAVGWLVGLVPFVPDREQKPKSRLQPLPDGSRIPVHVTGVLDFGNRTRRYRHRQAVLEYNPQTQLLICVQRKWVQDVEALTQHGAVAYGRLLPETVSKVRRGTAFLVTETRPAVELHWLHGRILLDFDDSESRDRVFARLAPW
jgi:hypothetical protein